MSEVVSKFRESDYQKSKGSKALSAVFLPVARPESLIARNSLVEQSVFAVSGNIIDMGDKSDTSRLKLVVDLVPSVKDMARFSSNTQLKQFLTAQDQYASQLFVCQPP